MGTYFCLLEYCLGVADSLIIKTVVGTLRSNGLVTNTDRLYYEIPLISK